VTVEQVAQAAQAFRRAGVLVHAYLMYGFPTQTLQETVDSAELVRQLFATGALSSAFWHRFVLTRHSGMYAQAESFGVMLPPRGGARFAENDLPHLDPEGTDHDAVDAPLVAMLAAWMRGRELARPVHTWFSSDAPPTLEAPDRIARALATPVEERGEQLVWIGGDVLQDGRALLLGHADGFARIQAAPKERSWLAEVIEAARPGSPPLRYADAVGAFPGDFSAWSGRWARVREAGLLRV
jgi:radical SAM superfamily enzyme YgiQ (UPF0313 family)